jgi:hypothetical protein
VHSHKESHREIASSDGRIIQQNVKKACFPWWHLMDGKQAAFQLTDIVKCELRT